MGIPENVTHTLTDEQKKKLEAARSPEELSAMAKECGVELTPDQLEAVSGGLVSACYKDAYCMERQAGVQKVI